MRKVDQGLGTIGLIGLAVILAVGLCVLLPVVKTESAIHASEWLGFSGNVIGGIIGGAMTLIAAIVAWRGVKHQVHKQVELAANLLEQDRAAIKAGIYAEIADRAARCMNDYIVPWKTWPKTRRLDPEIRKFAPTAPVVLPGIAGKLGLLDAETLPAVTQFYFRLAALEQAIDYVATQKQKYLDATPDQLAASPDPKHDEHVTMIRERLRSCFDPGLRALRGLAIPDASRFDYEAAKIYPHLERTGLSLLQALETEIASEEVNSHR